MKRITCITLMIALAVMPIVGCATTRTTDPAGTVTNMTAVDLEALASILALAVEYGPVFLAYYWSYVDAVAEREAASNDAERAVAQERIAQILAIIAAMRTQAIPAPI